MSDLTEKDLLPLLELFNGSDMVVLHVRSGDFELLLSRNGDATGLTSAPEVLPASAPAPEDAPATAAEVAAPASVATPTAPARAAPDESVFVTAPSLGAFYHSPRPDLPPYVAVGSRVEPDTTVGLIEAMKVFTAVSAGVHGIVEEFVVANNEFVEYGQPLLRVAPDAGGNGPQ